MKRSFKNILMILAIIILVIFTYLTMNYAKNNIKSNNINNNQQTNNMQTPPAKPGENNTSNDKENNGESEMTEPPAKPDDDSSNNDLSKPTMPNDFKPTDMNNSKEGIKLTTIYYVVFGIEALLITTILMYLFMSKFNKLSLKETFKSSDKMLIYVLSTVLVTAVISIISIYITNHYFLSDTTSDSNNNQQFNNNQNSQVEATASIVVSDEKTLTDSYEANNTDESVILVENGGNLTLSDATVNKASGDSSNTENSEFYGINAGILVTKESTATIKNATITTSAKGSNAVFATGENSKIYISNSTIKTTAESSSRGLDATYGGYIEADNVNITTSGNSCASLATDRGEGTVIANNSKLETNGVGSPVIYSTGDIAITKTNGVANYSKMVLIEGKNSATVTNSVLTASAKGNRNDVDQAGIMIYQSMSGDASVGTGNFTATNSSLSILSNSKYYQTAPMFFITNTNAIINLENTKLSYGSNLLISIKATDEWSNSGSNGGNLTFNANKQDLNGNIEVDNISTLVLNLENSSYSGTINGDNNAKNIAITLDSNSTITLTGDSYVTSLKDDDTSYSNINFNGYKLYVNGKSIN